MIIEKIIYRNMRNNKIRYAGSGKEGTGVTDNEFYMFFPLCHKYLHHFTTFLKKRCHIRHFRCIINLLTINQQRSDLIWQIYYTTKIT